MNIKLRLKKAVFYFVNSVDVEKDWKVFVVHENSRRDLEVISRGIQDQRIETDGEGTAALKAAIDALEGSSKPPSSGASGGQGSGGSSGNGSGSGSSGSGSGGSNGTGPAGPPGPPGPEGPRGPKGEPGENGKSAFQLATENGFTGSLKEWLNSLRGGGNSDTSGGNTSGDTSPSAGGTNGSPNNGTGNTNSNLPVLTSYSSLGNGMSKIDYHNGVVELHGKIKLTDLVGKSYYNDITSGPMSDEQKNGLGFPEEVPEEIIRRSTLIDNGGYSYLALKRGDNGDMFSVSEGNGYYTGVVSRSIITYGGIITLPIDYSKIISISLTAIDDKFMPPISIEEATRIANDAMPQILKSKQDGTPLFNLVKEHTGLNEESDLREKLPGYIHGLINSPDIDQDTIDVGGVTSAWSLPLRSNKQKNIYIRGSRLSYGYRDEMEVSYRILLEVDNITPGYSNSVTLGNISYKDNIDEPAMYDTGTNGNMVLNIDIPKPTASEELVDGEDFAATFRANLYT